VCVCTHACVCATVCVCVCACACAIARYNIGADGPLTVEQPHREGERGGERERHDMDYEGGLDDDETSDHDAGLAWLNDAMTMVL